MFASLLLALVAGMMLSRAFRLPRRSNPVTPFAARISRGSRLSDDTHELREGLEVKVRTTTGAVVRGHLMEKSRGGWWKVMVRGQNDEVMSVRTSTIEPVLNTTNIANSTRNIAASLPIDATKSELIDDLGQIGLVEDYSIKPKLKQVIDVEKEIPAYNLQRVEPPALHKNTNKWIIFSDLHVKSTSIETCEEVLALVHEEALKKHAGIMFLGDFWHVRGNLDVELLNRVLRSLGKWTQPVIMIPGNHDQVTLGGAVHSLEPLLYAFKSDQIFMISEPVVCMGALWVPYRRDPLLMKSILKAGGESSDVTTVYCHADVKGAYMNDGMRSKEGIEITAFPANLPIYSGHFHKPHTMTKGRSSIRYVGSPYQTSLSEASQDKFLYCMECVFDPAKNSYQWREAERWTIDVGKKYFKALSLKDPIINKAKKGDRVVLPVKIGEEVEAQNVLGELRSGGIEVEVRREHNSKLATSGSTEEQVTKDEKVLDSASGSDISLTNIIATIDPITQFVNFMDIVKQNSLSLTPNTSSNTTAVTTDGSGTAIQLLHNDVVAEGRVTIERLLNASTDNGMISKIAELNFDSVTISNFGPYGSNKIKYPLCKRGLTLIRGKSSDGTGADSNGSGKTTLAMSVMWGLTGSMDARLVADGRAVDVAYDGGGVGKCTAEVIIQGSINNSPFVVTRRRGARKNDLLFQVNGKDLTTQSVKDTQAVMDDILGIGDGLLQRCCFFGQHSHTLQSLLGLSDVKLKSEMSFLVDTKIWTAAQQDVRAREKVDKARVVELDVELRIRAEEILRVKSSLDDSMQLIRRLESELGNARQKVSEEQGISRSAITSKFGDVSIGHLNEQLVSLQREAVILQRDVIEPLRRASIDIVRANSQKLVSLDQGISAIREKLAITKAAVNASATAKSSLTTRLQQQEQQRSMNTTTFKSLLSGSNIATIPPNDDILNTNIDVNALRRDHETSVAALAQVNAQVTSLQTSLMRLNEVKANKDKQKSTCDVHDADNCPTCGQLFPENTAKERESSLIVDIHHLRQEQLALNRTCESLRSRVDLGIKAKSMADQLRQLHDRTKDLKAEIQGHEVVVSAKLQELAVLENELMDRTNERKIAEASHSAAELSVVSKLKTHDQQSKELNDKERALKNNIDELSRIENELSNTQTRANATISLIEDRLKSARDSVTTKSIPLFELEDIVARGNQEKRDIVARAAVYSRLGDCLGPRGIQHYIFLGLLRQLEEIANSYLDVLADGGIRLALQGDDDGDRIIKTVSIRTADGQYMERGLSQLSGGQWRRVSMALDFAFAEVIRRKGTLRSNLMVMDEVLTHLDASGREAVGTVLRAMVGPTVNKSKKSVIKGVVTESSVNKEDEFGIEVSDGYGALVNTDNGRKEVDMTPDLSQTLLSAGSYETVIVILQDLVAQEFEESFDHIDTVVKDGDSSTVRIDGADGR